MFRHKGKSRTYSHNIKLASILSSVAGIVNIIGVLALNTLTTNVTGHFAFFSEELVLKNYHIAFAYLFYILFFLLGAFVSNLSMEWASKYKPQKSYVLPISIEICMLLIAVFSHPLLVKEHLSFSVFLSSILLFSMGLQNALVTRVSESVVRTTHLTGLFTDLGIELSQLIFYKNPTDKTRLKKGILLKMAIITCFFLGGIIGGFCYPYFKLNMLLLPVGLLIFALWYDRLLFRYYHIKRKLRSHY